jgi:hypothetical protein
MRLACAIAFGVFAHIKGGQQELPATHTITVAMLRFYGKTLGVVS